jgi:protein transport protein SEC23
LISLSVIKFYTLITDNFYYFSIIQSVKKERFPLPRFIESDEGKSQARFLTARVDPTITHKSGFGARGDEAIATEDVTLEVFMNHLTKLAVQP